MNSKWNSFEQNADKKAVVEARPCIRHNVYLVLNFINESKFFVASTRTEYNRPSAGFKSGDLYSGWLDRKVVQNICLNKTKGPVTLIVPDPPEALKDCIETKGKQELGLQTVNVGHEVVVPISVENPLGEAKKVIVKPKIHNLFGILKKQSLRFQADPGQESSCRVISSTELT